MTRNNTSSARNIDKNKTIKIRPVKPKNKTIAESWFDRKHYHYNYEETLSIIYAMACIEIIATHSKEGGKIFCEIVNAWNSPAVKKYQSDTSSSLTGEEKQAINDVIAETLKDIKKPFNELNELMKEPQWWKPLLENNNEDAVQELTKEDRETFEAVFYGLVKVIEFIIYGFNRKADLRKGICRVLPADNPPWLFIAILERTLNEASKITIDDMRKTYKVVKKGNKVIDYEAILTGAPTNREHRRLVAYSNSMKLKLKHDKKFLDAALLWYQCRIKYTSIEKYCDAESVRGKILDPKNVYKEIKPCDQALGYRGRIKKIIK